MIGLKDRNLWFWIHSNLHSKMFKQVQGVIQTVPDVKILSLIENETKYRNNINYMKGGWKAHDHKQLSIMTKYTTYKGHNDVEAKKCGEWKEIKSLQFVCFY